MYEVAWGRIYTGIKVQTFLADIKLAYYFEYSVPTYTKSSSNIGSRTTRVATSSRARLKRDGTRAETRFGLSAKRKSPFKLAGASVQSTTGSRGVRIIGSNGSNAGYTMFRGRVQDYWLPTPLACFHFTSPTVRHCVPSGFNWALTHPATEHHQHHIRPPKTISVISSHRTPSVSHPITEHQQCHIRPPNTITSTSNHWTPSLPYPVTKDHYYHIQSPSTIATISSHRTWSHVRSITSRPIKRMSISWSKWKARFYTFTGNKYICIASLQLNSPRSCNEHIKLNRFLTIRSNLCKRNMHIV